MVGFDSPNSQPMFTENVDANCQQGAADYFESGFGTPAARAPPAVYQLPAAPPATPVLTIHQGGGSFHPQVAAVLSSVPPCYSADSWLKHMTDGHNNLA
eukprot:1326981-Rhodomonas_salina.1